MPGEQAFKEGAVIYFEHDVSGDIFLIREGQVELTREVPGSAPRRMGVGEMVGLADALGGGNRIETARALADVVATVITVEELRGMLTANVQIGLKVMTSLCAELREIDEMIVTRMRVGSPEGHHVAEGLSMIADHFSKKGMIRAARYAYGRYLEENPNARDYCDAALALGALCERDGDIQIAMDIYEELLKHFPGEQRCQMAYDRVAKTVQNFGGRL